MRTRIRSAIVLAALVTSGSMVGSAQTARPMVRLYGNYDGSFYSSLGVDGNRVSFHGYGTPEPVGSSNVTLDAVMSLSDPTPCERFAGATMIITTPAGHTITFSAAGRQCYHIGSGTGFGRLFLDGFGTFIVTGGTGPFAGAAGQGDLRWTGEVTRPLVLGTFGVYHPITLDGFVSAPL